MVKKDIKIALGDLRHETVGKHSVYVPIGIGYIASYTLSQFESRCIDLRLYTNPDKIIEDIGVWKPDVIGLANYCWNSSLSDLVCRLAKKKNPGVLCVQGGPEFPARIESCKNYLMERPEIDFYVYGDGEAAFANLVREFIKNNCDVNRLKCGPVSGTMCIHPKTRDILFGPHIERFKDMDIIPSPYLNGLLDNYLTNNFIPSMETARGCPFRCAYCHTGQQEPKIVTFFSVERIKDEIDYIRSKVANDFGSRTLAIFDSNWGMYKRDFEISKHLAFLINNYNWPRSVETSTAKKSHDRSLRIMKLTKNRVPINLSQQSMNLETLKVIQRTNIDRQTYMKLVDELKRNGQSPACELIIPMPKETKQTYLEGQEVLLNSGINTGTYTLMMLKGTLLYSEELREKYKMKTKFRILPRQFGEYVGEKCFEVEEVCVETDTMPFEDYLECRGFSYLAEIFSSINFDIINRHLKELKIGFLEYIQEIFKAITSKDDLLSGMFYRFIREASDELFDSKEAVYEYFSKSINYEKLISQERGDNLLRKYVAEYYLLDSCHLFEFAYKILKQMTEGKFTLEVAESLENAKQWASSVITVNSAFNDENTLDHIKTLNLSYDVQAWYEIPNNPVPLVKYKRPVEYIIFYEHEHIYGILDECKNLFGQSKAFQLGKFLATRPVIDLWRTCSKV